MHDHLRYNVRQAAAHLRMALNSLEVHGAMGEEENVDLELRLRNALALADAAYVEVGRVERLRSGDGPSVATGEATEEGATEAPDGPTQDPR